MPEGRELGKAEHARCRAGKSDAVFGCCQVTCKRTFTEPSFLQLAVALRMSCCSSTFAGFNRPATSAPAQHKPLMSWDE